MIGSNIIKTKKGLPADRHGFTLVELLIAAGIFMIVVVFGTAIYISISNVQKTNSGAQKVYTESRFLMNILTSAVQSYVIDEEGGYPINMPEKVLQIKSNNGTKLKYWLDNGVLKQQINTGIPTRLSSLAIFITDLAFYVNNTNIPSVTIIWEAKQLKSGDKADQNGRARLNLQTTISMRNY